MGRQLSPEEALASGRVEIDGDPSVLARCVEILAWPVPAPLEAPAG